jgi:hypothetical protein
MALCSQSSCEFRIALEKCELTVWHFPEANDNAKVKTNFRRSASIKNRSLKNRMSNASADNSERSQIDWKQQEKGKHLS